MPNVELYNPDNLPIRQGVNLDPVHQAGIQSAINTHSMRVTGANALLEAGVPIETVQHLMNHADPRTTKVYDRRQDKIDQGDIERMRFDPAPTV
jgi:integrase